MRSSEIWRFYWNPILLFVFTVGQVLFLYYLNALPGAVFPELVAWPQASKIISYVIGLVSFILALAWFVHVMFISWASVVIGTIRGIYKAVRQGAEPISKHGFLSGLLVACIYAVILVYVSHEMAQR